MEITAIVAAYVGGILTFAAKQRVLMLLMGTMVVAVVENGLVKVGILEALDAILDDPKNCDYAEETLQNGRPARRMHKFVKGFGTIAYCENGVYRPAKGEADDQKETIR